MQVIQVSYMIFLYYKTYPNTDFSHICVKYHIPPLSLGILSLISLNIIWRNKSSNVKKKKTKHLNTSVFHNSLLGADLTSCCTAARPLRLPDPSCGFPPVQMEEAKPEASLAHSLIQMW